MLKITIEGPQGAGKSTLATMITEWAAEEKKNYVLIDGDLVELRS